MTFVVDGAKDFISGLSIFGFAFLANLFYTFGWVVEIFLNKEESRKANLFRIKSFKIGLIVAISVTFAPILIFGIGRLTKGEKVSSPYSHFSKTEPKFNKLVGTYRFDTDNSLPLEEADKKLSPIIIFKPDSTFTVTILC